MKLYLWSWIWWSTSRWVFIGQSSLFLFKVAIRTGPLHRPLFAIHTGVLRMITTGSITLGKSYLVFKRFLCSSSSTSCRLKTRWKWQEMKTFFNSQSDMAFFRFCPESLFPDRWSRERWHWKRDWASGFAYKIIFRILITMCMDFSP